jgi:hypothetical protein
VSGVIKLVRLPIRLKKRIEERLRYKKSFTILERDLAIVWPRDERDQLKRGSRDTAAANFL